MDNHMGSIYNIFRNYMQIQTDMVFIYFVWTTIWGLYITHIGYICNTYAN